jgi:hypothetical protein
MVTKQLSIAIAIAISICLGSGVAWSDLKTFAAAPASETMIDFDQVFADATRAGEFNPSFHDGLRHVGWNFIITTTERGSHSLAAGYVNRARKSDRLPNFKSASPEPELLPYCEPVASPFADPILGRIVGRCAA